MELQEQSVTVEIADLISRLNQLEEERAKLLAKQRRLDADIIRHLAERKSKGRNDREVRRDLSRFARNTLNLTRSVAASRTSAALVAKANPKLLTYIRSGQIAFTAIRAMEPHREVEGLLEASVGKTRREVERVVAGLEGLKVAVEPPEGSGNTGRRNKRHRRKRFKRSKAKRLKKARQPTAKRPLAKTSV